MATVANNPITKGFSGTLGKTFVFKRWGNKTIVASYVKPKKQQSDQQKQNRSKFRDASNWAKNILKDPERKAYYQKKAKKLGLPNAYTAAITDYMRKPQVVQSPRDEGVTTTRFSVHKKGFAVTRAKMQIISSGEIVHEQTYEANVLGECYIEISTPIPPGQQIIWLVTDTTGKSIEIILPGS